MDSPRPRSCWELGQRPPVQAHYGHIWSCFKPSGFWKRDEKHPCHSNRDSRIIFNNSPSRRDHTVQQLNIQTMFIDSHLYCCNLKLPRRCQPNNTNFGLTHTCALLSLKWRVCVPSWHAPWPIQPRVVEGGQSPKREHLVQKRRCARIPHQKWRLCQSFNFGLTHTCALLSLKWRVCVPSWHAPWPIQPIPPPQECALFTCSELSAQPVPSSPIALSRPLHRRRGISAPPNSTISPFS